MKTYLNMFREIQNFEERTMKSEWPKAREEMKIQS